MDRYNKEVKIDAIGNEEKSAALKDFIMSHSRAQSKEQKLRNELLAIQYKIEDYIESENVSDPLRVLDFVKLYLKTFNITQKN